MGKEIERKYKVKDGSYKKFSSGELYRQGFLSTDPQRVVRVRVANNKGFLTVKSANIGAERSEFEYVIPVDEANEMLDKLCVKPLIEKYRYTLQFEGLTWVVDEFTGENEGLVLAEIELQYNGQDFKLPDWIGQEVTGDMRYYNSNLVKEPYKNWKNC